MNYEKELVKVREEIAKYAEKVVQIKATIKNEISVLEEETKLRIAYLKSLLEL